MTFNKKQFLYGYERGILDRYTRVYGPNISLSAEAVETAKRDCDAFLEANLADLNKLRSLLHWSESDAMWGGSFFANRNGGKSKFSILAYDPLPEEDSPEIREVARLLLDAGMAFGESRFWRYLDGKLLYPKDSKPPSTPTPHSTTASAIKLSSNLLASKTLLSIRVELVNGKLDDETIGVRAFADLMVNGELVAIKSSGTWDVDPETGSEQLKKIGLHELADLKTTVLDMGVSNHEWDMTLANLGGSKNVAAISRYTGEKLSKETEMEPNEKAQRAAQDMLTRAGMDLDASDVRILADDITGVLEEINGDASSAATDDEYAEAARELWFRIGGALRSYMKSLRISHKRASAKTSHLLPEFEKKFLSYNDFFKHGYMSCALELGVDGMPSEDVNANNLSEQAQRNMMADCDRFEQENEDHLRIYCEEETDEAAGYNFWLSRNGHGSGFFDEDRNGVPDEVRQAARELQNAARAFGPCDLYAGDDGLIHTFPESRKASGKVGAFDEAHTPCVVEFQDGRKPIKFPSVEAAKGYLNTQDMVEGATYTNEEGQYVVEFWPTQEQADDEQGMPSPVVIVCKSK